MPVYKSDAPRSALHLVTKSCSPHTHGSLPEPQSLLSTTLWGSDTATPEKLCSGKQAVWVSDFPRRQACSMARPLSPFRHMLPFLSEIHLGLFFRLQANPGHHHLVIIPVSSFFPAKSMDMCTRLCPKHIKAYDLLSALKLHDEEGKEGKNLKIEDTVMKSHKENHSIWNKKGVSYEQSSKPSLRVLKSKWPLSRQGGCLQFTLPLEP